MIDDGRNVTGQVGRHVAEYLSLKRMPDLHAAGIYPNAKEVTESMAAYAAVREHVPVSLGDRNVTLVAVGDGSTPRTAAMFAVRSAWRCCSVDPRAQARPWLGSMRRPIERLEVHRARIEDVEICADGPVVIAAVHSHATLDATLGSIRAPIVHVVAIPCCVPMTVGDVEPDESYDDPHCWSAKRRVLVWRNASLHG